MIKRFTTGSSLLIVLFVLFMDNFVYGKIGQ